jgi:hypothetical protein
MDEDVVLSTVDSPLHEYIVVMARNVRPHNTEACLLHGVRTSTHEQWLE